ncbi:GPW/gp25 family protein [Gloeomargarita lithophora Alchichica-D10]|uniref:GPW/gp25 family protein n=1 Tax=Gloeomargarita lithophora Alchichica-D10 TaxID=1188229 RepID=A0A1J0AE54_9CYAN|nr:GPW/gp25 family protein [Gloeomargarita lithophora]APB34213.1 GPW/gp25 family protein [Gloeomargarita lithophora Alchichica-D10]
MNDPGHLGRGWAFPPGISPQGGIQLSAAAVNVREAIWIILTTELGERVYRSTFGCRLGELVFAPLNSQTLLLTRLYVEEALQAWEPRIILDQVVTLPEATLGRVVITINYRLKATYEPGSVVYPFYLNGGQ